MKRNTTLAITKRALRKCTQFYANGVHAYCTPVEFLALCQYFDYKPDAIELEYYTLKVKQGQCKPTDHYICVNKFVNLFPISDYAILHCMM